MSQPAIETGLPTLADRPGADVVIYDGKCGFCQQQMRKLDGWDKDGQLAYVSLHDPKVAEGWPDLNKDDLMREICVVSKDGGRFQGADAFRYISSQLRALWPVSLAMRIPWSMPIWRFLYRRFARQRYWLSRRYTCKDDSCDAHLP
jgi:predicted DCC family thiol-disulfide oxidoreductase YuxK